MYLQLEFDCKPNSNSKRLAPTLQSILSFIDVIMDDGNVKEITTQAYWIPEMKCRLFSPQSFFEDNGGDSTEDYKFMVGRGSCCCKFGEGLDNQLTLHMDPNTKLH